MNRILLAMDEIDDHNELGDIFQEPAHFRPPSPQASVTNFTRLNGSLLTLHLPAEHSLWAHCLWNAGKAMANHIDSNPHLVNGKRVLELGAAAALPSLVCALNGATVISTDYPDPQLVLNIEKNACCNIPELLENGQFQARGFLWGDDCSPLIKHGKFDLILLADLIFNHSQHVKLLETCRDVLKKGGVVLTTFSHHLPQHKQKDLGFFAHAHAAGFSSECVRTETWPVMFEHDQGDRVERATVYLYRLSYAREE